MLESGESSSEETHLSTKPWHRHFIRHAVARLIFSIMLGISAGIIAGAFKSGVFALILGWDVCALSLIVLSWRFIAKTNAHLARSRASTEDPGRNVVWILVCLASAISLFASAAVMRQAKGIVAAEEGDLVIACLAAVILSWVLTHTAFTLRYARLYYSHGKKEGGLNFPGADAPDDRDFAYFSFTIGMTFQVSDITVSKREIRTTVLLHALLSFAYNTVLVALALNLFFGYLGH